MQMALMFAFLPITAEENFINVAVMLNSNNLNIIMRNNGEIVPWHKLMNIMKFDESPIAIRCRQAHDCCV